MVTENRTVNSQAGETVTPEHAPVTQRSLWDRIAYGIEWADTFFDRLMGALPYILLYLALIAVGLFVVAGMVGLLVIGVRAL